MTKLRVRSLTELGQGSSSPRTPSCGDIHSVNVSMISLLSRMFSLLSCIIS
jgi:hypothetical protein